MKTANTPQREKHQSLVQAAVVVVLSSVEAVLMVALPTLVPLSVMNLVARLGDDAFANELLPTVVRNWVISSSITDGTVVNTAMKNTRGVSYVHGTIRVMGGGTAASRHRGAQGVRAAARHLRETRNQNTY